MSERSDYPSGVPCWVDTLCADAEGATRFYTELFGWQYSGPGANRDTPQAEYFVARIRDRDAAGIGMAPESGIPVAWNTYIAVDDLDAAIAAATEAGGEVLTPPVDASPAGSLAILRDPAGAAIGLWQAETRAGAQVVNEPSAWAMSQLQTTETAREREFYGAVFGWEFDDLDMGGAALTLCRRPGYLGGEAGQPVPRDTVAIMLPGEDPPSPARWTVGFWIADADGAAERAPLLGGSVVAPPFDIPGFRSAVLADPAGAIFSISELRL